MKTNENFQLSTFNFQPDKRLAVVILNWNGRALMEEFLPSVVACTPGEWADVIVADNGSTDDSIEMLKTKFPTVGIIRLDKNYGFAEGYNQALKHIGHEYTVLLNSDVEVTPGWLDAPIAALDADKTIAGVQPKIRAQRNKEYFEYAGAAGGYMDRYGYPYCRGRVLHVVEKDAGQYDTPATCFGPRSLPVRPYGHLQRGGRPRCRVLCPPGRNRSVLAATFARLPAGLYAIVGRVPRGRRHAECRESAQDVPQLPKQPADAI